MARAILCFLILGAVCAAAYPESFAKRLANANAQLRSGNAEDALSVYRELQVDEPESDVLYYNTGCAQYQLAEQDAEAQAGEGAIAGFERAKTSFEKALYSPNHQIRQDAEYNLANSVAEMAKLYLSGGKAEEAEKMFKDAIMRYEDILRKNPAHENARHNLEHMRYLLKKMLQNPPPPQESEGQSQDQQKDDKKKEQEKEQESKSEQEQEQKQNEQQQASQQEQSPEQNEQSQEMKEDETGPKDRQNVEAILQSLEDVDKREQRETRNQRQDVRMRKDWW